MTAPSRPLWIARVAGDQAAMGRQHGALLAAAGGADATFAHYRELPIMMLTGEVPRPLRPAASLALRAVSDALLRRLAAARPAELAARSEAFLAGLGRPARWARYLSVMDLFQNYVGTAARWGVGPFARPAAAVMATAVPACSTVVGWDGVTADGAVTHARNFDFPGIGVWDAAPAIVLCTPDRGQRYGFVTTRGGDTPVVTVWNEAGLVITSHTRFHREVRFDAASIVDLVHELGRRAETLADAARIAAERPVASTWGLAVSSARERRAVVLELHAARVAVVAPAADHLICCNRYRDRAMQVGEVTMTPAWALHSDRRERRLATLVAAARGRGGAGPLELAAMLLDREDDDAPGVARQLGAVVAQPCQVQSIVVAPAAGALWLGMGAAPVGEGAWLRVDWDWAGAPGAWELGSPPPVGLGVTVTAAGTRARAPASDAVAAALAIDQSSHHVDATAAALARAIAAAPADPSLRLGLVWTELRRGGWARAVTQAAAGLAHEALPYRRGQLLLWGARAAAAAGDAARAATWRGELAALHGAGVPYLQDQARDDAARPARAARRRVSANLFMLEATWA